MSLSARLADRIVRGHRGRRWLALAALPLLGGVYLIHPGDTLSGIAAAHGDSLAAVEAVNPQITNPNLIFAGATLNLPSGNQVAVQASGPVAAPSGASAFERCVISRESGGNPKAQNPTSTASGLYQFLDTTWAGYGGYAHAKDAPASVQRQYFLIIHARDGESDWHPYDGC